MKRIYFLIALSGLFYPISAQHAHLDLYTQRNMRHISPEKKTMDFFAKGNLEKIKAEVIKLGGIYKYGYAGICAVEIPIHKIDKFLQSEAITGLENAEIPVIPMLDTSIINACVLPVHQGMTPLDAPYKGDGVIVGVIDDGIDFDHPDFTKPNGDTRIRYLWDQNVAYVYSVSIAPYQYGREWSETDINNGICTHAEQSGTHGTNVAGIAAGNGKSNSNYTGMAPNSDIIIVSIKSQSSFLSHLVDAVDYIFKKADAMGKPCVINISYGTYQGSHDGRDFASQMIDALLEQRNGRSVVAAAGNGGSPSWNLVNWHLGYDVTADTSFTWFKSASYNEIYFQAFMDTADFNDVNFAISVVDPSDWSTLARTNFMNVKTDFGIDPTHPFDTLDILMQAGTSFLGLLKTEIELTGNIYRFDVWVPTLQNSSYYWTLETFGSGKIDIWSITYPLINMDYSNMIENVPPDSVYPSIVNYKFPDNDKTLTSSFQNSDKVITVGNYVQRHHYVDFNGDTIVAPEILNGELLGDLAATSSHGPTRDNRIKPDITAPGSVTMTAGNLSVIASYPAVKKAPGGYHSRNGATSMSSPVVAGVAALYLEKYPDADWKQVKDAIIFSAKTDTFTGVVPNNLFGWGKVCAFGAMQLIPGCTDTAAFNYDSLANIDDGSCIAKVYGCMDTNAINYDPTANVEDSSCVYDTTTVGISLEKPISVSFYPNPCESNCRIVYRLQPEMAGKTSVNIFNTVGQKVQEFTLGNSEGTITFDPLHLSKGVYFYTVSYAGKILANRKLVIY